MPVFLTRRFAFLLTLSAISLTTLTCTRPRIVPPTKRLDLFCTRGNYSESFPMICVNEQKLTADPRSAKMYDIEPDEHGHSSGRPVVIHWFTQRSAGLQIVFKQTNCTETPICNGHGECTARVKPLGTDKQRQCTYNMFSGELKDDDADIIINPCCG